jgi:hypothetical protein
MPEHAHTSIQLGARGWDFPAWHGGYFPEDLPPEWRLTYYANDFRQVLVPEGCWAVAEPAQGRLWREDVSETFRFYLELTDPQPRALGCLAQWGDALGSALGGTLATGAAARQAGLERSGPTFRVLEVAQPAVLPELRRDVAPVAVLLLPSGVGSVREQRRLFTELVARIGAQGAIPVFFCGDPPPLQALRDARELAELMGIA